MSVKHVGEDDFKATIKSDLLVLVDFYADWCGPCKMLTPVLEELAAEFEEQLKIVKVNVDESQALAQNYQIRGIPALFFFKDGEIVERLAGALPKAQLASTITALLSQ